MKCTKRHTKEGSEVLNNLKKARLGKNMTQDELAHILGITVRTYQYIEYGQRKPSYDVILKLQELFNSNINSLLSESTDMD
jgi:transcriptional regulator with XRE-family HTH domain